MKIEWQPYESVSELERCERRERGADDVSEEIISNAKGNEKHNKGGESKHKICLEERHFDLLSGLVQEGNLGKLGVELGPQFNEFGSHL